MPAGILIGLNAALISIVTAWLSDMKLGYCSTGWWLSQKFCCAEISAEGAACEEWRSWGGIEPFQYIAYVLFAVSAASGLVQLLVGRMLAYLKNVNVASTTGPVLLFSGQARQIVRSLCSRVGYIRDQVYPRWIHHQRVPQHLDTGHQESDSGKRFVFVHWSARILSRERSLCSLLRSDRGCRWGKKVPRYTSRVAWVASSEGCLPNTGLVMASHRQLALDPHAITDWL